MQLSLMTWPELQVHLTDGVCAVLPIGSIEQHGPMGLIGTDAICADAVAQRAAVLAQAICVPPLVYTPAPFNTQFPGTVSIDGSLLTDLLEAVCKGLLGQGFLGVYVVNGHGANLDPIAQATQRLPHGAVTTQSWWAPAPVMDLRAQLYGDWEGMHATPSEVAITQALHGVRPAGAAADPPQKLSAAYIRAHAGDRHGPPDAHRAQFPDGRVGSHSALATPEDGARLLALSADCIATEIRAFAQARQARQAAHGRD